MTVCSVKLCHNSSEKHKKINNITFHRIPIDPVIADKWVKIIRLSRGEVYWKPTKNTRICSKHFDNDDKYITQNGLCKLHRNAVPNKELHILCPTGTNYQLEEDNLNVDEVSPSRGLSRKNVDKDMKEAVPETLNRKTIECSSPQPISADTVRRRLKEAEKPNEKTSRNCELAKKKTSSLLRNSLNQTAASQWADVTEPNDENTETDNVCRGCDNAFSGFVYECIQCDYRMCASCDEAGMHKDHYVLRVPAHSSKSEVEMVMARVRTALQDVDLEPPPDAGDQRVPGDSDEEVEGELEPTVEVKMEAVVDDYDPLQPTAQAELPVEVKTEPEEDEPSRGPVPVTCVRVGSVTQVPPDTSNKELGASRDVETKTLTIKIEPPDEEPSTSQFVPTTSSHRLQNAGKRPLGGDPGPEGEARGVKQKRQKKIKKAT